MADARRNQWRAGPSRKQQRFVCLLSPMAHLTPHSLFLLFLAVHVFVASHGFPLPPSSAYNDSVCSESFRCGVVDIRYPFYQSNSTGATPDYTSYSCGYTDWKIFCQGEGETAIASLQLGQDELHNYTVHNIFYDNYTIILGDTEGLISGCPTITHNVSFSDEWLNYTNSLKKLTFFFDCFSTASEHVPTDPLLLEKFQIECKGFKPPPGSGDGVSYVFTSEEGNVSWEYELAEHCSQVVTVPVYEKALVIIGAPMLLREYGAVLKEGFELEWKQSKEHQCYMCEKSKGRCAYGENKELLACLCSGGNCTSRGAAAVYPKPPSSASGLVLGRPGVAHRRSDTSFIPTPLAFHGHLDYGTASLRRRNTLLVMAISTMPVSCVPPTAADPPGRGERQLTFTTRPRPCLAPTVIGAGPGWPVAFR